LQVLDVIKQKKNKRNEYSTKLKNSMAKFLSRIFGGGSSSSKRSTLRGSQPAINESGGRTGIAANIRGATSLDNLASYSVNPKELEKNKLHKASWEGNLHKVERLARPGQINVKDQQQRV